MSAMSVTVIRRSSLGMADSTTTVRPMQRITVKQPTANGNSWRKPGAPDFQMTDSFRCEAELHLIISKVGKGT